VSSEGERDENARGREREMGENTLDSDQRLTVMLIDANMIFLHALLDERGGSLNTGGVPTGAGSMKKCQKKKERKCQ
jgi:hypothetical protein